MLSGLLLFMGDRMAMNRVGVWGAAAALVMIGTGVGTAQDLKLAGRWDASVVANTVEVPFVFEIVGDGPTLKASFFNGEQRITSTAAQIDGSAVTFTFAQYGSKVQTTLADGVLTGEYLRATGKPFPFKAARAAAAPATVKAPSIDGSWVTTAKSNKGETAWRFIAKQKGAQVSATILRVDGDTGTLTGSYKDGKFVLSHFSGARPLLLEVTPGADGTLTLVQNKTTELKAVREESAAAKTMTPADPTRHTSVKDPNEPFRFAFPDLTGKVVTNTDPAFAGKVVFVSIGGSWCPNCHDEAPFLSSLYKRYHAKGLEIVTLSFEEGEQLKNPVRLRAFIKTYGIDWTVLIPGEPDQLNEKIPQGVNLNAFPTTFILGRDGRVRAVHAGFPSPGSGEFYTKAEHEITEQVERLLAERAGSR